MAATHTVVTDYLWYPDTDHADLFVGGAYRKFNTSREILGIIFDAFCNQKEMVVWAWYDDSSPQNNVTNIQLRYRNGAAGGATG